MAGVPEPHRGTMAGAPEPNRAPLAGAPEPDQRWHSLAEEATCPICLGYFEEPVSTQCGHTFCTHCITRYWNGVQGPYPCPQCRETAPTSALRPNWLGTSIVQLLVQGPHVAPVGQGPLMCMEHDEKLKLFCQEDQTPICVVCDRSREHRGHTVTPIWEAAREYQDKFQRYLDDVKRELEKVLGLQRKEEVELTDLQEKFKLQKERITSAFDQVQQFLKKEKCRRLCNLEEEEMKTQQRIRGKVTRLEERQMMIRDQITEMEAKSRLPDVELLKDVKNILSRFEKIKCQYPDFGNFKEQEAKTEKDEDGMKEEENEEQKAKGQSDLLLKIIESLEWRWACSYSSEVTLDPVTAHCELALSADLRSVRKGNWTQHMSKTPESFNVSLCVLGRERLRSGRHYWEVEVGGKTAWLLGVCDESASRKGVFTLSPEAGYWAVGLCDGAYRALTSPCTPLAPRVAPRVVGLFLDREVGRFSVYNVTDWSLLFTFPGAPFSGVPFSGIPFPHTLRPLFSPGLRDGEQNAGPLWVLR